MPPPEPPRVKEGRMMTGKADLGGEVEAVAQIVDQRGARHVEADARHRVLEEEAIFGFLDGLEFGADQLHAVLVEDARVGEFDGEIERGLAADGGQDGEFARRVDRRAASRSRCGGLRPR